MSRTIQCDHCGVVLNLPDVPAGKRLKCPKCGAKFMVREADLKKPTEPPSAHDASPDSSQEIKKGHGDFDLPTSAGDLRETFDLPLMTEAASSGPTQPARQASDALALFEDDKTPAKPKRKPKAAEARSKARRCPTCGGVVPAGMSLCSSCGLDLETGVRIGLDDDDLMPEAPVRPSGIPLPVATIGGICFLGSLILGLASIMQSARGQAGWIYFVPVCLFGVFASVQFLRGKTAKLLLVALTFGAFIDVLALIALPIYKANVDVKAVQSTVAPNEADMEDIRIQSVRDRLDTQQLTTGIVLLIVYAGVATYLASSPVRRHFSRST